MSKVTRWGDATFVRTGESGVVHVAVGGYRDVPFDAVERLAFELAYIEAKLDPSITPWLEMDEHTRAFYRHCVEHLLAFRETIEAAIEKEAHP